MEISRENFNRFVSDGKVPDALALTRRLYCLELTARHKCVDCALCAPVLVEIFNFRSRNPRSRLNWRLPMVAKGEATVWIGEKKIANKRLDRFGCPASTSPFDELLKSLS